MSECILHMRFSGTGLREKLRRDYNQMCGASIESIPKWHHPCTGRVVRVEDPSSFPHLLCLDLTEVGGRESCLSATVTATLGQGLISHTSYLTYRHDKRLAILSTNRAWNFCARDVQTRFAIASDAINFDAIPTEISLAHHTNSRIQYSS